MLLCKNDDSSAVTTYEEIAATYAGQMRWDTTLPSIGAPACLCVWLGLPVPAGRGTLRNSAYVWP